MLWCVVAGLSCREEGMLGLWKGLGPNIARNAIINAAELASYDQIKVSLLATGEALPYYSENVCTLKHTASGGRVAAGAVWSKWRACSRSRPSVLGSG